MWDGPLTNRKAMAESIGSERRAGSSTYCHNPRCGCGFGAFPALCQRTPSALHDV